jgi:hypothetical protein
MVRTTLIPKQNDVTVSLPDFYIGKTVEITFFALDELNPQPKKTLGDFMGMLPESDYQSLKTHTEKARKEWDRAI